MNLQLLTKRLMVLWAVTIFVSGCSVAPTRQEVIHQSGGAYATINTADDIKLGRILTNGSPEDKARSIQSVMQTPTKFSPGVLYSLSSALLERGDKDDAIFWFLVADLRARYDAQRCADDSARSGAAGLRNHFGASITPYMRENPDKLEAATSKALKWDESHAYEYDHRWIAFHGLKAIAGGEDQKDQAALSLPESEWPEIRKEVRSKFEQDYRNAVAALMGKPIKKSEPLSKSVDLELMKACSAGDTAGAELALKHGANPNTGTGRYTVLHMAATSGRLAICKLLVSRGADVNASSQGQTPLLCAARYCHPEVIEFLLKSKAEPKVRNSDGLTAIMTLLNEYKRSDAAALKMTTTTSEKDALAAIKMLLAAGVDPNIGATFFGTPLVNAAFKPGCVEIVRALLDGGAKVNESDGGIAASTALHAAVSAGDLATVKLLVSRGADINARDQMKLTPLGKVKKGNASEIQKYLIEHGAKE